MDILPTTRQAYDLAITAMSVEIQTLRAKVASAEVLVEALHKCVDALEYASKEEINGTLDVAFISGNEALATYEKLSEVNHG